MRALIVAAMCCVAWSACNNGEPPASQSAVIGSGSGPGPGSGSGSNPFGNAVIVVDAGPVVDAMQFALFDHLAFRMVKRKPAAKLEPPADFAAKLKLGVRPAAADVKIDDAQPPAWMQHVLKKQPIVHVHVEADGSSIGATMHAVVLVDASHRAELGIDLGPLHGDIQQDEGGDHTFDDFGFQITDAHRDGTIVVVAATDPQDELGRTFLMAIDSVSGAVAWVSERGATQREFMVSHGCAIVSREGAIDALRLDTGRRIASVATHAGAAIVAATADGKIVAIDTTDSAKILEVTVE